MPLLYRVEKLDTLPEAQRALYVPDTIKNTGFILDVPGVVEEATHAEFRNNNRELMRLLGVSDITKAREKLETLKDVDPAEYARVKNELAEIKKKGVPDLETEVTKRTGEMKTDFEKKLEKAGTEKSELQTRLAKILIDDALATAAVSKGVLGTAVEDVKLRGRGTFRVENGELVAYDVDGKTQLYGKDGKPLTIPEWMDKLGSTAGHLFEPNRGGGSHGGGGGNTKYTSANPYSTKTLNRTEQARLEKVNPAQAEALKASAEV